MGSIFRKSGKNGQKGYYVHRFVQECCHGSIPESKIIDHINSVRDDNRNLQLITQNRIVKKSAEERDYSFAKTKKNVTVVNCSSKETTYYDSMYAEQQHLGINAGINSL